MNSPALRQLTSDLWNVGNSSSYSHWLITRYFLTLQILPSVDQFRVLKHDLYFKVCCLEDVKERLK